MILSHPTLEQPLTFENDRINVLVIENRDQFSKYVCELNNQSKGESGNFVLSIDDKCIEMSNLVKVVIDPFNLDLNAKDILTQVYNRLYKISLDENHYCSMNEHVASMTNCIAELLVEADLDMDFKDCSMADVIKMFSPKFIPSDDLVTKITDYLDIASKYSKCRLFTFVNLGRYLNSEKLTLLEQHIVYQKYNVLFIESDWKRISDCENIVIIDENLCEIR